MTKSEFLTQYRAGIIKAFAWTQDAARLDRFMASVEATVYGPGCPWNHNSDVATAIYRANGGKGKVTLKWLRALPDADFEGLENKAHKPGCASAGLGDWPANHDAEHPDTHWRCAHCDARIAA